MRPVARHGPALLSALAGPALDFAPVRVARAPTAAALGLLVVAAFADATPLIDGATRRPVSDAALVTTPAYAALAPVCTTLDALTVLSVEQHLALLATLALLYVAWRAVRSARRIARRSMLRAIAVEVALAAAVLAGWVAIYAVGALVPRPMAAIAVRGSDALVLDVHSHTSASWDGRKGFDARDNRRWHAGAGFHATYVTDHGSFRGARRGMLGNPATAGAGTTLLPGVEARDAGVHINVIGVRPVPPDTIPGDWRDPPAIDTLDPPLTILTIPGRLRGFPDTGAWSPARFVAVELSDASPRGIGQEQRRRAEIVRLADSLDLAIVAGSDNHGWGSTAAAWTVLRIPGWRALPPVALDSAVRQTLRERRRSAARVVERDVPDGAASPAALAATLPAVLWTLARNLGGPERLSWAVWIVGIAAAVELGARRPGPVGRRPAR